MRVRQLGIVILVGVLASGCAVQPVTFEESLQTTHATRSDVRDWDEELRYRVELQYANTARQKLETLNLDIPPNTSIEFQVPFAIWQYARGDNFGGAMGFADWFNSGLSKEARYAYYFKRGLGYMGNANTHYFTFDERDGTATAEDVHQAWNEAYALFQAVYNANGDCYVTGFTEQGQYARTYPKDVAGLYKDIQYQCPNPAFPDEEQKVMVTAYANPFEDVRVVAGTVAQCYVPPPRGQKYVDTRACGERLAARQRPQITESRFGWTELVITPVPATPELLEVVVRRGDDITSLPAPEMKEDYEDFLRERPYP